MERVHSKEARFLATLKKFFVCFSTWYPSNRKAIFLLEKIFEKVMYIENMGLFCCYPYMAEYLARIFSKYSYTVLTALESCFAISG